MKIEFIKTNSQIVYKNIIKSKPKPTIKAMDELILINIYDASVFLKTILKESRYELAQQFISHVFSEPPQVLNSYIVVNIIVEQLEFHRNYLSAVNIVLTHYWDIVRRDNIVNKILVNLSHSFETHEPELKEIIIRADRCMKRIEKEMITICGIIRSANLIIWRYTEELRQIAIWDNSRNSLYNCNCSAYNN